MPDLARPTLLVVSPVKDEAEYLERTIASMVAQTVRPTLWVIVNDGSSDRTGAIADAAARAHSWIVVRHRPAGTGRRVGPGVVEAFYTGLDGINLAEFHYVCKLDGDLEFAPTYFADCLARFVAEPRLGTISGKCYVPTDDELVLERSGDQFSHGVAKLYRRTCFEEIGGFVHEVMWDGIDCHRCRMLGWKAVSDPDPRLRIVHLRQMGSSHKSVYHGRRRWGRGQYFMGTHPLYILFVALYRTAERPWFLGGANILIGYFQAWVGGVRRYDAPGFRAHLRGWQMRELFARLPRFAGKGSS
jgi:poly-beta-1,6-N-acetyl-D-glucosamine synthase